MVLGNIGYIPPMTSSFTSDSACLWGSSKMALLIGHRIHTHGLGYWVSGYRYRDGYWKPIAAGRPQDPEDVIPTKSVTLLREGDALTARCYYQNTRPYRVNFGPNYGDEMCNLHLIYMFPFGSDPGLRFQTCAKNAQDFHLSDYFHFIPNDKVPRPTTDDDSRY
ncbi:peptidylglycine alpha-hydroxylating monooxygenase-like [Gigantopelta aegis]|uniref:peptidylglycine alpha-hydroxylating monooxygenase-like n=1 Tax=Gigantopelta aegis TaxID=1735272 RepID=UPI001B88DAD2|nr:peptidylglycine alpha-hydroxylating monooxygenase-like [Gigantopelta aegis]XP_041360500.1 peptidylglycine alpha-hydroxylating monooxygenase-like [Gigantopelta aegis]